MKRIVNSVPRFGDSSEDVKKLQEALKDEAEVNSRPDFNPGPVDGDFHNLTLKALKSFQRFKGLTGTGVIPSDGGKTFEYLQLQLVPVAEIVDPEWLANAKKYKGENEGGSVLSKIAKKFWKLAGLNYDTFKGNARAWCAVAIIIGAVGGGGTVTYQYVQSAGARTQGKGGIEINWKRDGLPRGARIWLNHNADCNAGSGNHITVMDGECAAEDIVKNGKVDKEATFPGYGGNQGNEFNTSWYPVYHICRASWPSYKEENGVRTPLTPPGPVLKSNGCNGRKATGGSTQ